MIDFLIDCGGSKTVITCTHELHVIEDIADRCIVLKNGRVAADATPTRILADENLLNAAHLLHSHRHRHPTGIVHSHPHLHRGHDHTH